MKLGRTYIASVSGQLKPWVIQFPYSCRLKVSATGTPAANVATFHFWNLPEDMRNDLSKDVDQDDSEFRGITFSAGYKGDQPLPVVFVGNVYMAYSYREGPNWITELTCFDGGFAMANGSIDESFGTEARGQQVIRALIAAMPHVTPGYISDRVLTEPRERGLSISGNPWDELVRRILPKGADVFISNGRVNVLGEDEVIPSNGNLDEVSAETGMIGSPKRQASIATIALIFEPRLSVGQKVTIKSVQPYAGDGKILQVEHQGTISPVMGGDLTTAITLIHSQSLVEVAA